MAICVISKNGERLMPTVRYGVIRHLLKDGKAIIVKRKPFTVQLLFDTTAYIQNVEICVDSGYEHVGVSIKTAKRELFSEQYDMLKDEKQRHDDQRRYRRTRRNRKRYRAPRFNNRKRKIKFMPSIQHKFEAQLKIIDNYTSTIPVSNIVIEIGQFDPAVLKAVEEDKPIPQGADYQYGERYGIATLREAVLQRDNYTCCFCGKGVKDGAILHVHHALYWQGRHGNRVAELATCCEKCHTTANHQEGGKLWGYKPKVARMEGAAFMNTVRWEIVNTLKAKYGDIVHFTYGAMTKIKRSDLGIDKTHANDAYAMGEIHPKERAEFRLYTKRCRNNRILEKFYDAKVVDTRDWKEKAGKALGCERINRREPRVGPKSLRPYRGKKVKKGERRIRKQRYPLQTGDIVFAKGKTRIVSGTMSCGKSILFKDKTTAAPSKCIVIKHCGGWY